MAPLLLAAALAGGLTGAQNSYGWYEQVLPFLEANNVYKGFATLPLPRTAKPPARPARAAISGHAARHEAGGAKVGPVTG